MSSGQEKIDEFPEDDAFWYIKWVDEFRIPHIGTRSASVSVILQKLSFTKISDLGRLTPEGLLKILGQRTGKDENITILRPNPLVMPGTLPLLHIGAIYHNKVRVGELPTRRARLKLMDAFNGDWEGQEITLGETVTPPPRWMEKVPHYLLNKYEYSMVSVKMQRSRCWVVNRDKTTYVIPRMTIFKTFYACHSELAKAFCNGPWSERLHDVICMSDFESGLKTEALSSGQWNIILQTLVPDNLAELLALYYFDPYARACAESIYSMSFQDRDGKTQAPWYASAKIPFNPTWKKHRFDVRGFQLRSWKYKDEEESDVERQKFLVTEIIGSSWPEDIPDIGYERANSGQKGATQTRVEDRKPYQKTPRGEPSDPDTQVSGEHDADASAQTRHMNVTEFEWLNPPKKHKLKKGSSKQYMDPGGPLSPPSHENKVSTGEHTYQQDTVGKGEAEIIRRELEKRFEHIYEALQSLTIKNFITSMQVVPCTVRGKQIRLGNRDCWSFIDEDSLKYGHRARRGWRWAEYEARNFRNSKYRSALVVKLEIDGKLHYWIEIECRGKEGGYRSPLLSNVNGNPSQIIAAALEIIVEQRGINLKAPLNFVLNDHGVLVDCYKHFYESKGSAKLDIDSVKRFLMGR